MAFPISTSGTIEMPGTTVKRAMECLERALADARALAIQRNDAALRFKGGAFRLISNWNVLVPVSSGALEVSPSLEGVSVKYRLAFTQMVLFVTFFVLVAGWQLMRAPPVVSEAGRVLLLAIGWLWMCAGNFMLTRWRFRSLLMRALSSSPE